MENFSSVSLMRAKPQLVKLILLSPASSRTRHSRPLLYYFNKLFIREKVLFGKQEERRNIRKIWYDETFLLNLGEYVSVGLCFAGSHITKRSIANI